MKIGIMHTSIIETYRFLAKESSLELLYGHRKHFEDLQLTTGYLKVYEIECYKLITDRITDRITELENEIRKLVNSLKNKKGLNLTHELSPIKDI